MGMGLLVGGRRVRWDVNDRLQYIQVLWLECMLITLCMWSHWTDRGQRRSNHRNGSSLGVHFKSVIMYICMILVRQAVHQRGGGILLPQPHAVKGSSILLDLHSQVGQALCSFVGSLCGECSGRHVRTVWTLQGMCRREGASRRCKRIHFLLLLAPLPKVHSPMLGGQQTLGNERHECRRLLFRGGLNPSACKIQHHVVELVFSHL
mmetsp:Transcript_95131/g.159700  ORF Transcript_95131/g.159700 Transcript_95131/m.159700 type:complete len:206 (+) Transcript_95131:3572-4189(+)